MTTNQTIDGVPREDLELVLIHGHSTTESNEAWDRLRTLLEAESVACAQSQVEGKRERFQKWVMATKHPVYGFLDGRSLARGDDGTGYADEYVQGLWVAYLAFGAEQPAPVSVVLPKRRDFSPQSDSEWGWNACLDEAARLTATVRIPEPLVMTDGLHTYEYVTGHNAAIDKMLGVKS
ncbi:hypothetical protein NM213_05105 [Pseudomonas lactis]|uniref:hypothetical protein n=1 Tax=Pseudomonas lactis TaxID=1615674 RepID=UPI00054C3BFC|nr:hypothetical protein [Pseudomonas lactis]MDR8369289.1 hypothetical protein [Pseudomonas lactis]